MAGPDQQVADVYIGTRLLCPVTRDRGLIGGPAVSGSATGADGSWSEFAARTSLLEASRTITPSPDAWHRSGDLLSDMAKQDGLATARVARGFANDIRLALSCRESGCVLVTENDRAFSRIRQFISFEYMKPWPPPM